MAKERTDQRSDEHASKDHFKVQQESSHNPDRAAIDTDRAVDLDSELDADAGFADSELLHTDSHLEAESGFTVESGHDSKRHSPREHTSEHIRGGKADVDDSDFPGDSDFNEDSGLSELTGTHPENLAATPVNTTGDVQGRSQQDNEGSSLRFLLQESFENLREETGWHVEHADETGSVVGDHGVRWSVNRAGIEVQFGNIGGSRASDGMSHVELDPHGGGLARIETIVQLQSNSKKSGHGNNDSANAGNDATNPTTSDTYTLTFDYQPRPGHQDDSDMKVEFAGKLVRILSDAEGNVTVEAPAGVESAVEAGEGNWTSVTLHFFNINLSSATLAFEGLGNPDTFGAYLDDISLRDTTGEVEPTVEIGPNIIIGTPQDDELQGTDGDDEIYGLGGNDDIDGGDGDDVIDGGSNTNTETGPDLTGTPQDDELFGTDADETIDGLAGDDLIDGGGGDDTLIGGTGDDRLKGDEGNDSLDGGAGADYLDGGVGNDSLVGGAGNDRIYTGYGDDVAHGGDGNDTISGWAGGGPAGNKTMYGDAGDDHLTGAGGVDQLYGGEGNDTLRGEDGADILDGGSGDDTLYAGDGDDILKGGSGNDVLHGDTGADRYILTVDDLSETTTIYDPQHGTGADILVFEKIDLDGEIAAISRDGYDLIFTFQSGGTLTVQGQWFTGSDGIRLGIEKIEAGGTVHDVPAYFAGTANTLQEFINFSPIVSTIGNDTLTGGEGKDLFVFGENSGADIITDFSPASRNTQKDQIDLTHFRLSGFESLAIAANADGNAVIDLSNGDEITLLDVSPDELGSDDFLF